MKILKNFSMQMATIFLLISYMMSAMLTRGLARTQKRDRMTMHVVANTKARPNHSNTYNKSKGKSSNVHLINKPNTNRITVNSGKIGDISDYEKSPLINTLFNRTNEFAMSGLTLADHVANGALQVSDKYNSQLKASEMKNQSENSKGTLQKLKTNAALAIAQAKLDEEVENAFNSKNITEPKPRSAVYFKKKAKI